MRRKTTLALRTFCLVLMAGLLSTMALAQEKKHNLSESPKANSTTTQVVSKAPTIEGQLNAWVEANRLSRTDVDYVITAQHVSRVSGIHHMYFRQAINGLEVQGTESSLHVTSEGTVVRSDINFLKDISTQLVSSSASISAANAIRSVSNQMNYEVAELTQLERNSNGIYKFNKAGISATDIPVKPAYYYVEGIGVRIIWELSVEELNSSDWWNFRVDATSGTIIDKHNFTVSCFEEGHNHAGMGMKKAKEEKLFYTVANEPKPFLTGDTYHVFPVPVESPNHGSRIDVTDPHDTTASPFGWHDTNGVAGDESNYTIGNNCDAYDDSSSTISGTGSGVDSERAFGGAGPALDFDYPLNTNVTVGDGSIDAAVTNLFYWTNICHDITYQYGFDEASGNFQSNNYGNGGVAGDSVRSEAQDGSGTCNANFATPTDGGRGRMQMYVCGTRDGDLDNGVIVHEFGHGISTRLTGGAGNSGCLNTGTTPEQMGEGWSDYYALMYTMETGDAGTDSRGIGTWLIGEGAGGDGIRTYPYSTNVAINPHTYADITSEAVPHGVGSVWCAMLWDMTWALIDDYGFSTDFYTFTGSTATDAGNVQALALVTEALKLQPCSPGFVDGRDAILLADQNIYGGANQCAIWDAFAARGLGYSADQGSSASRSDGTQAFDLPPTIAAFTNSVSDLCLSQGVQTGLTGGSPTGGVYTGPGVTDDGNGTTYTFDPSVAGVGVHTITYTVPDFCSGGSPAAVDDTITVSDDTLSLSCPSDIVVNSTSATTCEADVLYNYPVPQGDVCNRTSNRLSQNTNETNGGAIDCDGDTSGHLRQFSLSSMGVVRDYTISGIDVMINTNASAANITVNIYLNSQLTSAITTYRVPISGSVTPYATATSLVPAGSGFVHNVPFDVFLPATTSFTVEVISPSTRSFMVGYNDAGVGNPPNDTFRGYTSCNASLDYTDLTTFTGADLGHYANIIAVQGTESNEYTTTQIAGLPTGSTFPAGTTTNTYQTSAASGGSTTCSFDVTVEGLPTTYNGATWSAGAPQAGSHAIFDGNYNTSTGNIDACSCEVNSGRTVTVGAGQYMNIYGNIDVNGTLIVEHQGSIVQTDNSAVTTNNGTINVNLTTPNLASRDFMVLGSPMSGEARESVWSGAFLVLDAITPNFVPHPDVEALFPGAENFADDNNDFWAHVTTGSIPAGEGFIVRPQAGYGQPGGIFNYTYDGGTLNTGNVDFTVIQNTPGPTAADNKNASPNVMANPYPSAIWADDFINANAMVDEVYFWEHLTPPSPSLPGAGSMNFSMEDISMYNLSGGTPAASDPGTSTTPNGYISTGQGFGIKASAAGTATFTNAMRRTDNNNTLRTPQERERIWLSISNAEYSMQKQALLAFDAVATEGMDAGYDSRRLATVVSLYTHLPNGEEQLGIQTREAFENSITVPVGYSTLIDASTTYKISISDIEGAELEQSDVFLVDNITGLYHDLKADSYEFTSEMGTFHNRFTLYFSRVLNVTEDSLSESIAMLPNPTTGELNIVSPQALIQQVEVYDLMGRKISSIDVNDATSQRIDLSSLNTSIYFVTVTTDQGTLTKKVIKK